MFNGFKDPTNFYSNQPPFENCNQPAFLPCEGSKQTSAPPWDYTTQTYNSVSFYSGEQHMNHRLAPTIIHNPPVLPQFDRKDSSLSINNNFPYPNPNNNHQTLVRPTALINCQSSGNACCNHPSRIPHHWNSSAEGVRYLGNTGATLSKEVPRFSQNVSTFLHDDARFRPTDSFVTSLNNLSRFPRDTSVTNSNVPTNATKKSLTSPVESCTLRQQCSTTVVNNETAEKYSENSKSTKKTSCSNCPDDCRPSCRLYDRQTITEFSNLESDLPHTVSSARENVVRHTGHTSLNNGAAAQAYGQWPANTHSQTEMWLPNSHTSSWMHPESVRMSNNAPSSSFWMERNGSMAAGTSQPPHAYQEVTQYKTQGRDHQEVSRYQNAAEKKKIQEFVRYEAHRKNMEMSRYQESIRKKNEEGCQESQQKSQDSYGRCQDTAQYQELSRSNPPQVSKHHESRNKELSNRCHKTSRSSDVSDHTKHKGAIITHTSVVPTYALSQELTSTFQPNDERRCLELMSGSNHNSRAVPPNFVPYTHNKITENYTTGIAQPPSRFSSHITYTQSKISRSNNDLLLPQTCNEPFNPSLAPPFTDFLGNNLPSIPCKLTTTNSSPINMTGKNQYTNNKSIVDFRSTQSGKNTSDVIRYGASKEPLDAGLYNMSGLQSCNKMSDNIVCGKTMQVVDGPVFNVDKPSNSYISSKTSQNHNINSPSCRELITNPYHTAPNRSENENYNIFCNTNNMPSTQTSVPQSSYETMLPLGPPVKDTSTFSLNDSCVSDFANHSLGEDGTNRPIKKRKSRLKDVSKQERYSVSQNLKRWQRNNQQGTEPVLDVRQFLATWDEESEDLSSSPKVDSELNNNAPLYVLDCRGSETTSHANSNPEMIRMYQQLHEAHNRDKVNVSLESVTLREGQRMEKASTSSASDSMTDAECQQLKNTVKIVEELVESNTEQPLHNSAVQTCQALSRTNKCTREALLEDDMKDDKEKSKQVSISTKCRTVLKDSEIEAVEDTAESECNQSGMNLSTTRDEDVISCEQVKLADAGASMPDIFNSPSPQSNKSNSLAVVNNTCTKGNEDHVKEATDTKGSSTQIHCEGTKVTADSNSEVKAVTSYKEIKSKTESKLDQDSQYDVCSRASTPDSLLVEEYEPHNENTRPHKKCQPLQENIEVRTSIPKTVIVSMCQGQQMQSNTDCSSLSSEETRLTQRNVDFKHSSPDHVSHSVPLHDRVDSDCELLEESEPVREASDNQPNCEPYCSILDEIKPLEEMASQDSECNSPPPVEQVELVGSICDSQPDCSILKTIEDQQLKTVVTQNTVCNEQQVIPPEASSCSISDDKTNCIVASKVVSFEDLEEKQQQLEHVELKSNVPISEPDEIVSLECQQLEKVVTHDQQPLKQTESVSSAPSSKPDCRLPDGIVSLECNELEKVVTYDMKNNEQKPLKPVESRSSTPSIEPNEVKPREYEQLEKAVTFSECDKQQLLEHVESRSSTPISEPKCNILDKIVPVESHLLENVEAYDLTCTKQKHIESKCNTPNSEPDCNVSDEVAPLERQQLDSVTECNHQQSLTPDEPSNNTPDNTLEDRSDEIDFINSCTVHTHFNSRSTTPDVISYASTPESIPLDDCQQIKHNFVEQRNMEEQDMIQVGGTLGNVSAQNDNESYSNTSDQNSDTRNNVTNASSEDVNQLTENVVKNSVNDDKVQCKTPNYTKITSDDLQVSSPDTTKSSLQLSKQVSYLQSSLLKQICHSQNNITSFGEVTITPNNISCQPLHSDVSITNIPSVCTPHNMSVEVDSCVPEIIGIVKNVSPPVEALSTGTHSSSLLQIPDIAIDNTISQTPDMLKGSITPKDDSGNNTTHANEELLPERPPHDYNYQLKCQQLGIKHKSEYFSACTHPKSSDSYTEDLQNDDNNLHVSHSPMEQKSEDEGALDTDLKSQISPSELCPDTTSECESTAPLNIHADVTETIQDSKPVSSDCENATQSNLLEDIKEAFQDSEAVASSCDSLTHQINYVDSAEAIQDSESVPLDCEKTTQLDDVEDVGISKVSLQDETSKTTVSKLTGCCKTVDNCSSFNGLEMVSSVKKAESRSFKCSNIIEETLENIKIAIETELTGIEDLENVKPASNLVQPSVCTSEEDIVNDQPSCELNQVESEQTFESSGKQVLVKQPVLSKEMLQDDAFCEEIVLSCSNTPGDVTQQCAHTGVSELPCTVEDVPIECMDSSGHCPREDLSAESSGGLILACNNGVEKWNNGCIISDSITGNPLSPDKITKERNIDSEPLLEQSDINYKKTACEKEENNVHRLDISEKTCSSDTFENSDMHKRTKTYLHVETALENGLHVPPNEFSMTVNPKENNVTAVPYINTQPECAGSEEESEEKTNEIHFSHKSNAEEHCNDIDMKQNELFLEESKQSDDSVAGTKNLTSTADTTESVQNEDKITLTINPQFNSALPGDAGCKTDCSTTTSEPFSINSDCKMITDEDITESLHCVSKESSSGTESGASRTVMSVPESSIPCSVQEFAIEEEMPQLEMNSDATPSDSDLLEMPYLEPASEGVSVITEVNVSDNSPIIVTITEPEDAPRAKISQSIVDFEIPALHLKTLTSSTCETESNLDKTDTISSNNADLQMSNILKESDSEDLEIERDTVIDNTSKTMNNSGVPDCVVSCDSVPDCTEICEPNLESVKNRQEVVMFNEINMPDCTEIYETNLESMKNRQEEVIFNQNNIDINENNLKLLPRVSETEVSSSSDKSVMHMEPVTNNSTPEPTELSLNVNEELPPTVSLDKISVPYSVEHSQELNIRDMPVARDSNCHETADEHLWSVMSERGLPCFDGNSEILPVESVLNWPYLEEEVVSELPESDADLNATYPQLSESSVNGTDTCQLEVDSGSVHLVDTVTSELNASSTTSVGPSTSSTGIALGANDLKCRLSWKKIFDLSKLEERKKQKTNERKQRKEASRRWPYYGKIPCKRKQMKDIESSCRKPGRMSRVHTLLRGSNACKDRSNKDIIDGLELGPAKIEVRLAPKPFSEDHSKTWQVVDVPNSDKISIWTASKENNNNYMFSAGDLKSKPEEGNQVPIVLVRRLILKRRTDDNTTASEESTPESGSPTTECSSLNYEEESSDHNHEVESVPGEETGCDNADDGTSIIHPPDQECQFRDDLTWNCRSSITNHQDDESHLQNSLSLVTNLVRPHSPHSSGNESCVSALSQTNGVKRKRKQQLPRVIIKRTGDGAAKYRSYLRVSGVDKNQWQPVVCLQRSTILDNLSRRVVSNSYDINSLQINISQLEKMGLSVNFSQRDLLTHNTENHSKTQNIPKLGSDLKLQTNGKFNEDHMTGKKVCKYVVVEKFTKDTKITFQRDKGEGEMEVDINLQKEKLKVSKEKKTDKDVRKSRKETELAVPLEQYKENELQCSETYSLNSYTKDTSGSLVGTKTTVIELRRHSEDIGRKQICKRLQENRTKSMCLEQTCTEQQIFVNCQTAEDTPKAGTDSKPNDEHNEIDDPEIQKKPSGDDSFLLNSKQKKSVVLPICRETHEGTIVISKNSTTGRKRTLEELQKKDIFNNNVEGSVSTSQDCSELKKKCLYSPKKDCREIMRPEDLVNLLLNKSDLSAGKDTLKQTSDKILSSENVKAGTGARDQGGASDYRNEEGADATCRACGWTFGDKDERAMHIRKHPYHCQRCHLAFKSEVDFVSHLSSKHPSTREQHHCLLCERSFSTTAKHQLHLSGRMHRQLETIQRRTIHTIFTILTGHSCPGISPMTDSEVAGLKWFPAEPGAVHFYHQATPLQMAVQDWMSRHQQISSSAQTNPSEKNKIGLPP